MLGQRSFDDLGTPLHEVTFCVVDFETTGGNRTDDLITEIGAVKVQGGTCIGTFHTLVNPGCAIPPRISVLTGITDAAVRTAPRIEAVLGSLMDFLDGGVFVAHNAPFDLGFLRSALRRDQRAEYRPTVIDTATLARRLLRDEVPNCKLSTLAGRLRLDHTPSHRALDDALATTDLLHALIERATGLGVTGLDDLASLPSLARHPQAAKLSLTDGLPRRPGVYMFEDRDRHVLYVGKATNLRQRVRSYFTTDDRRRIGAMLRETASLRHIEFPDPLSAEIVERRLIRHLAPRYNRVGTRSAKYCYVRLDTGAPWPRLAIVGRPSTDGVHLGPLPSRATASQVVDAILAAVPLRRCSTRLGPHHRPDPATAPCGAAQIGVAQCPCAGLCDRTSYDRAVDTAVRTMTGDPTVVTTRLIDRMSTLAAAQRFEDAAVVRDRLTTLLDALRRRSLTVALLEAGRCTVRRGRHTWVIDGGRLIGPVVDVPDGLGHAVEPPPSPTVGMPLSPDAVDEAVLLARFFDRHSDEIDVIECSGTWTFPVDSPDGAAALTSLRAENSETADGARRQMSTTTAPS